ncbi:MAG: hypothetical protein MI807_14150 [Verrucomicrobiales bacterium]|nr:hypothetical protein [Verrucomicrobiales bacterium]
MKKILLPFVVTLVFAGGIFLGQLVAPFFSGMSPADGVGGADLGEAVFRDREREGSKPDPEVTSSQKGHELEDIPYAKPYGVPVTDPIPSKPDPEKAEPEVEEKIAQAQPVEPERRVPVSNEEPLRGDLSSQSRFMALQAARGADSVSSADGVTIDSANSGNNPGPDGGGITGAGNNGGGGVVVIPPGESGDVDPPQAPADDGNSGSGAAVSLDVSSGEILPLAADADVEILDTLGVNVSLGNSGGEVGEGSSEPVPEENALLNISVRSPEPAEPESEAPAAAPRQAAPVQVTRKNGRVRIGGNIAGSPNSLYSNALAGSVTGLIGGMNAPSGSGSRVVQHPHVATNGFQADHNTGISASTPTTVPVTGVLNSPAVSSLIPQVNVNVPVAGGASVNLPTGGGSGAGAGAGAGVKINLSTGENGTSLPVSLPGTGNILPGLGLGVDLKLNTGINLR